MKAYLTVTAVLFGLLAILHLWRAIAESSHLASDPWFLIITVIAALFSFWGFRLLAVERRRPSARDV